MDYFLWIYFLRFNMKGFKYNMNCNKNETFNTNMSQYDCQK
jgi:hypothetical protein